MSWSCIYIYYLHYTDDVAKCIWNTIPMYKYIEGARVISPMGNLLIGARRYTTAKLR